MLCIIVYMLFCLLLDEPISWGNNMPSPVVYPKMDLVCANMPNRLPNR